MIYKIHKSDMEMSQNSFRKHFLLENSITRMTWTLNWCVMMRRDGHFL